MVEIQAAFMRYKVKITTLTKKFEKSKFKVYYKVEIELLNQKEWFKKSKLCHKKTKLLLKK